LPKWLNGVEGIGTGEPV